MHICFLCNEYPPGQHGGVGSFTQTLSRALVAKGHQVSVVGVYLITEQYEENDEGVRVIRLANTSLPKAGFLFNGKNLRRTLVELHKLTPIDLLEGPENSFAAIPPSLPGRKIIRMNGGHNFFSVTLGKTPSPWRSWLEKRSFKHADRLCAVSNFVAETTRDLLRLGKRTIEIIPNPVATELFFPRLNPTEREPLIVFVGTVCEKKGVRQLVQAMPQIVAAVPGAKLWVVGRDLRDPVTGESFIGMLSELIPNSLKEQIVFKGAVEHSHLPDLLAQASVCVYPSHMEALPVAWLEGLAMGKAVVASHTGPGKEVIEDNVTGLLCDPYDPTSIAAKIIMVLKDKQLRQKLGERARSHVEQTFSIERLVNRNEDFYRRCLAGT